MLEWCLQEHPDQDEGSLQCHDLRSFSQLKIHSSSPGEMSCHISYSGTNYFWKSPTFIKLIKIRGMKKLHSVTRDQLKESNFDIMYIRRNGSSNWTENQLGY